MDGSSWIIHAFACPLTTCAFQLQNRNGSRGWRAKAAQHFFRGKENTLTPKKVPEKIKAFVKLYLCNVSKLFLPDAVRNVCPLESRNRPRRSLWSETERREIKSLSDRGHLSTCAALMDSSDCLPIYLCGVKLYVHES